MRFRPDKVNSTAAPKRPNLDQLAATTYELVLTTLRARFPYKPKAGFVGVLIPSRCSIQACGLRRDYLA